MTTESYLFWPKVNSLRQAKDAARQGVWCAGFVSVATFVVTSYAVLSGNDELGFDAWSLVDAGIFAAIAYGIHRFSRVAVTAGLLLFLFERLVMLVNGELRGLWVAAFIVLGFVNSLRGVFTYHELRKEAAKAQAPLPPGTA